MGEEPEKLLEDEARSPLSTDDAPPFSVLAGVRYCAAHWAPEARIIGNVRAGDIVRSVDDALSELATARAEIEALRAQVARLTRVPDEDDAIQFYRDLKRARQPGHKMVSAQTILAALSAYVSREAE